MKVEVRYLLKLSYVCISCFILGFVFSQSAGKGHLGVYIILLGCGIALILLTFADGLDHDLKLIYHKYDKNITYEHKDAVRENEKNENV